MNKLAEIVEVIVRATGMALIVFGALISIRLLLGKANKVFEKPVIPPTEIADSALSHYTDWTFSGIVRPYTIEAASFIFIGIILLILSKIITNIICKHEQLS